MLKCKFTRGPHLVLWAAPERGIFDVRGEAGHTVDSSSSTIGEATLTVNEYILLKSQYACTAFYGNGTEERCLSPRMPVVEGRYVHVQY